jgi:hypothetical protein
LSFGLSFSKVCNWICSRSLLIFLFSFHYIINVWNLWCLGKSMFLCTKHSLSYKFISFNNSVFRLLLEINIWCQMTIFFILFNNIIYHRRPLLIFEPCLHMILRIIMIFKKLNRTYIHKRLEWISHFLIDISVNLVPDCS